MAKIRALTTSRLSLVLVAGGCLAVPWGLCASPRVPCGSKAEDTHLMVLPGNGRFADGSRVYDARPFNPEPGEPPYLDPEGRTVFDVPACSEGGGENLRPETTEDYASLGISLEIIDEDEAWVNVPRRVGDGDVYELVPEKHTFPGPRFGRYFRDGVWTDNLRWESTPKLDRTRSGDYMVKVTPVDSIRPGYECANAIDGDADSPPIEIWVKVYQVEAPPAGVPDGGLLPTDVPRLIQDANTAPDLSWEQLHVILAYSRDFSAEQLESIRQEFETDPPLMLRAIGDVRLGWRGAQAAIAELGLAPDSWAAKLHAWRFGDEITVDPKMEHRRCWLEWRARAARERCERFDFEYVWAGGESSPPAIHHEHLYSPWGRLMLEHVWDSRPDEVTIEQIKTYLVGMSQIETVPDGFGRPGGMGRWDLEATILAAGRWIDDEELWRGLFAESVSYPLAETALKWGPDIALGNRGFESGLNTLFFRERDRGSESQHLVGFLQYAQALCWWDTSQTVARELSFLAVLPVPYDLHDPYRAREEILPLLMNEAVMAEDRWLVRRNAMEDAEGVLSSLEDEAEKARLFLKQYEELEARYNEAVKAEDGKP